MRTASKTINTRLMHQNIFIYRIKRLSKVQKYGNSVRFVVKCPKYIIYNFKIWNVLYFCPSQIHTEGQKELYAVLKMTSFSCVSGVQRSYLW